MQQNASKKPCPVCNRQAVKEHAPFCSKRCADADLGNWIMEKYRVAAPASAEDDRVSIDDQNEDTQH